MKKFVYLLLLAPGLLSGEALAQLSVGSSATLYVGSGATLSVNGTLQNAGTLTNAGHVFLRGHLQNTAALASAEGDLTLDGSAAQTLASPSALSVRNLTLNNPASGEAVTLATPLTVGGVGTFTDGVLKTDATNLLTFADGSTVAGASNDSHVKGPVRKVGSAAFVFPLGNGGTYRPASLAPQAGTATDVYRAAYVEADPGNTTQKAACVKSVSSAEYWQVDRLAGSASAVVGLAYQNVATSIASEGDLRVGRLAGSGWEVLTCNANGGLAGGWVLSSGVTGQYGRFALAFQQPVLSASYPGLGTVCAGQAVSVTVVTEGVFGSDNAFTAQLSDAGGSFANPVSLGTVVPGQNQAVIPPNTPFGTGYRLRVVSSLPPLTSEASTAFTVNALSNVSVALFPATPSRICLGEELPVTFSTTGACPFPVENVFTVHLSNATGSFANPTVLGTAQPGTTPFVLPQNLPVGTGYRVRVVTSGPAQSSQPSAPFELRYPSLASLTPGVGGVPQGGLCRGNAVTVSFSLPSGSCPFPNGNAFTAQLSNGSGAFSSPVSLGTVVPGVANSVTIPANVVPGTGYRIRIVSSQPQLTSLASLPFRVNACVSRLSAEAPDVVVAPNPAVGSEIRLRVRGLDNPAFSLISSTGRSVGIGVNTDGSGEFVLTPKQALTPGVYAVTAEAGPTRITRRVLVVE